MKILIKVNPKELESLNRFYVTKNNQLVKSHLTYDEALDLKKRLKQKTAAK